MVNYVYFAFAIFPTEMYFYLNLHLPWSTMSFSPGVKLLIQIFSMFGEKKNLQKISQVSNFGSGRISPTVLEATRY